MRVTIYQPQYFPRLHYFHRILNADIFVLLDTAQYTKSLVHQTPAGTERHKSYQSDTPIKTGEGVFHLTVPVESKKMLPINQTAIAYMHKWDQKHKTLLKAQYAKAPYFSERFPSVQELLTTSFQSLSALNSATIMWGLRTVFALPHNEQSINEQLQSLQHVRLKKIVLVSELGVKRPEGRQMGTEWTTGICEVLGATEYYHGETAGNNYMDVDYYIKRGIRPVSQKWHCPSYNQQYMKRLGFIPNLSILDLLFNESPSRAREVLGIS